MKRLRKALRAIHRHPPTYCLKCGTELIWDHQRGKYINEETRLSVCGVFSESYGWWLHELANGKRAHHLAGGNQLTMKA